MVFRCVWTHYDDRFHLLLEEWDKLVFNVRCLSLPLQVSRTPSPLGTN